MKPINDVKTIYKPKQSKLYLSMRKQLLMLGMSILMAGSLFAQRECSSMDYLQNQMDDDPKRAAKMDAIESQRIHFENIPVEQRAVNGVITIPCVVHVIYNNSTENISDAQILSQIQVMNDDFRRLNSDADNTWSQATDSEIEFCMANVDPSGGSTNGIVRKSTSTTAFGTNDQMKFDSSGGSDAWPAGDYLNLWVCDISGGILGYAQFPGGAASTDGVVMDYQYFGTIGTATAPFDLGRTATHEVGHWLNLRHIWGDGNCNADDFVSDTPSSDAANYGCASNHVSCSSTDMVQNYMDYSDDACMNLFTEGQKTRMRALFDTGGFRESVLSSAACGTPPPPATCDDGIQNGNETGIDCGGSNCAPCPCNGTFATVSITLDNYPEETSWSLTSGGSTVASGGTYPSQPDGSTISFEYCLADGCYDFTINDSYGDGICCSYGSGSYLVTSSGGTHASGGSFTSSETTNFCLGGGPAPTCSDGIQNQGETGVDCGGPCSACASCSDGIQNQGETGVDCGGPCPACATCSDGVQNQGETGVDCGGPCAACSSCSDGVQNGSETGVDCGGSCPACPTCSDGVQNGDETGVDCGGSCAPCGGGGCSYVSIDFNDFESSWGIWNDGGSDCRRSRNDGAYAWSGTRPVRIRDNTSSSTTTTDNLNLSAYDELTVEFYFYARSMENNEDFWLQISTNGGSSYTTVASYAAGSSFSNNGFYTDQVVIPGPFTSTTRLRFRNDASGNSDWIYIDDVTITGCLNNARESGPTQFVETPVLIDAVDVLNNVNVYPNPTSNMLNVAYNLNESSDIRLYVTDMQGRVVLDEEFDAQQGANSYQLDTNGMADGTYILTLFSVVNKTSKRFVIQR